jgi:hypothetical protein
MNYLPLFLNVKDRLCVVVGGGFIGGRKTRSLVEAGARVTVISPEIDEALMNDVLGGRVQHVRRVYRKGDLKGCLVAYAATGRADVDKAMMAEAQAERVLLNVVDRTVFAGGTLSYIAESGSIGDYIDSLQRLRCFDLNAIYPGHGRISKSPGEDIEKALRNAESLLHGAGEHPVEIFLQKDMEGMD